MPGENRSTYVTATLSICMITTVLCGGFTERILYLAGMKNGVNVNRGDGDEFTGSGQDLGDADNPSEEEDFERPVILSSPSKELNEVYDCIKDLMVQFDQNYLMVYFGGNKRISRGHSSPTRSRDGLGNYELGNLISDAIDSDSFSDDE